MGKTLVYFRGGPDSAQNESNAAFLAEEFLGGAVVKVLGEEYETEVADDTQLVVIVGEDYWGPGPRLAAQRLQRGFAARGPFDIAKCQDVLHRIGQDLGSEGFVRNASAPSSKHRRWSSICTFAVRTKTGRSRVRSSARSSRST